MPRCTHGMGLGHTAPLPFPMENACLPSTDCFAFIQTQFPSRAPGVPGDSLPLPSRGERSELVSVNWFNLFSGADVKHFVIGDNSTFSEVGNQTQRLQVADNEIN